MIQWYADPASDPLQSVIEVFTSRVAMRSGACTGNGRCIGSPPIRFRTDGALEAEAFAIRDAAHGVLEIVGGSPRGVLYGAGRLLRGASFEPERFLPGPWRGESRPAKPCRGIYFATHFYNFYQSAPVEAVERYVEDLALCGMNRLAVWYDMHHFNGFDDPQAEIFRARLRRILQAARRLDLDIMLIVVGNEAYADSPDGLRADPGGGRGGYYDAAVCPAKPGGLDYIRRVIGEYFDWARVLGPTAVCIWPYDQGGCGCPQCRPWGASGFMRCAEEVGRLTREKLPGAKIVLSTWYMDPGEWAEVARRLCARPESADALLMEHFHASPGPAPFAEAAALGLPLIGFPEISMHGMFPWGGFGANPQPMRFAREWSERRDAFAGGFPYSEGVFDDVNKALWLRMYWDQDATVEGALDDYISFEFGLPNPAPVREAILTLERNHHFRWWPGKLEGKKILMDWFPSRGAAVRPDHGAKEAFHSLKKADALMPHWGRRSWRWRILFLRGLLDAGLKANGNRPDAPCEAAFHELNRLYFVNDATETVLRAPSAALDNA